MKTRIDNLRRPSGKVPAQSILKTTDKADESLQKPIDPESFEVSGTDTSPMGSKVGTVRAQPPAAGTRPMNVTATVRPPRAPGLVASQGKVTNARPAAPGLNQNMTANVRPPRAAGLNNSLNAVRKTQKVTAVPAQRNRNVRQGSANPGFYQDF